MLLTDAFVWTPQIPSHLLLLLPLSCNLLAVSYTWLHSSKYLQFGFSWVFRKQWVTTNPRVRKSKLWVKLVARHFSYTMLDVHNLVTYVNQTPVFEWYIYVVGCSFKNQNPKEMWFKEVGVHVEYVGKLMCDVDESGIDGLSCKTKCHVTPSLIVT